MNVRAHILTLILLLTCGSPMVMGQLHRAAGGRRSGAMMATRTNRADYYNFIYVSSGLGYSSLLDVTNDIVPSGNIGNMVGLGYEFRYQNFWMSVGAQTNWHRSKLMIKEYQLDMPGLVLPNAIVNTDGTTEDLPATAHYHITERDSLHATTIDIPLLIGYYNHGFYVGAGPKISFGLNTKIQSVGNYYLTASTDRYVDDIVYRRGEMADGSYHFTDERKLSFRPLISICGEIGYDVLASVTTRSAYCNILKVGFYFECGVNSWVRETKENTQLLIGSELNGKDAEHISFKPRITDGGVNGSRVIPFFTGLKITYMFGGNVNSNHGTMHTGCQCYE